MKDRHSWQVGASTCILGGWQNYTDNGFALYKEGDVKLAELSILVWNNDYENLDFYEHPEKLHEIAMRNDVLISSFHAAVSADVSLSHPDKKARDKAREIILRGIRSAAKIGIKNMVLHPSCRYNECYADNRQGFVEQTIGEVKQIYDACKEMGVTLAVENMTNISMCNCAEEMICFLKEIPGLCVCFDTNHPISSRPDEYLDKLIAAGMHGRISNVHISDYDFDIECHRLPGDGKINWEAVLSKLEELDYNGVFMYEVSVPRGRDIIYTPQMVRENFEKLMSGQIICNNLNK